MISSPYSYTYTHPPLVSVIISFCSMSLYLISSNTCHPPYFWHFLYLLLSVLDNFHGRYSCHVHYSSSSPILFPFLLFVLVSFFLISISPFDLQAPSHMWASYSITCIQFLHLSGRDDGCTKERCVRRATTLYVRASWNLPGLSLSLLLSVSMFTFVVHIATLLQV